MLESWEELIKEAQSIWGISIKAGTVYVYEGQAYVVRNNTYLSRWNARVYRDDPDGLPYLFQPFDPTEWIDASAHATGVWDPPLMKGTVYYDGDSAYVFLGSDYTIWESLPADGGYWVRLI